MLDTRTQILPCSHRMQTCHHPMSAGSSWRLHTMRYRRPKTAQLELTVHLLVQLLIEHHANVVLLTRTRMIALVVSPSSHDRLWNWTGARCGPVRSFHSEYHPSEMLYQLLVAAARRSTTARWHALCTSETVPPVHTLTRSKLRREIDRRGISNRLAFVGNSRTNGF